MSFSEDVQWVNAQSYALLDNGQGSKFYVFTAVDESFNRLRIHCDYRFKDKIVHFLAAIDAGIKKQMPIQPKKTTNGWHVAFDYVDRQGPVVQPVKTNKHVAVVQKRLQKQSFYMDPSLLPAVEKIAKGRGLTKSELYRDITNNYIKLNEQMDQFVPSQLSMPAV